MATIPDLPTVSIQGVELLFPGTFEGSEGGANTYSSADIQSAVSAFPILKSLGFTPKAKLGHSKKQALLQRDGFPSAGDITNAYLQGDRLIVDVDGVPAKLAALIKAGGYRQRSAELLINGNFNGTTYPLALKGFAWLGEDAPAVTGLDDSLAMYTMPEAEVALLSAAGGTTVTVELAAPTQTVDGKAYGKSAFAYTPSDTPSDWKLRLIAEPGDTTPDSGLVGAAAAALGPGFRGQKVSIPDADRPAVIAKVRTAWHKANPDKKDDEMPDVLRGSASHSRSIRAALRRLVSGTRTATELVALAADDTIDPQELTSAQKAQQVVALINDLIVDEANEQLAGEDEDDDIRELLMARDIMQRFAQGELLEDIGIASGDMGSMAMLSASPEHSPEDKPLAQMQTALAAFKAHLDGLGKGKRGVGMARVAHKMLAGYVKQLAALMPPDAEPPAEPTGQPAAHSRAKGETMEDTELRTLLGLDEGADLKQALLSLKGRSVDLSEHESVKTRLVELERREAHREAAIAVEKAIDGHKLAPKQREWAIGYALADGAAFEAFLSVQPDVWSSAESGSAATNEDAPKPPTAEAAKLAADFGISLSELTPTETFAARVAKAKETALAGTVTRRGG